MKILHLVTSLNRAGLEKLIFLLCRTHVSDSNNQFMVVVLNDAVDQDLIQGIRQTRTTLVEMKRRPGNPLSVAPYVVKLRKLISDYRPDVIHVHNNLSFLAGFLASRFLGISMVYTIHDTRLYSSSVTDRASKWLALKGIDRFIAISESVKTDFTCVPELLDKVTVVPNCIDLSEFSAAPADSPIPVIICVARLNHEKKGQDLLLSALALVKERALPFRCRLVGDGPSRIFLERMTAELGLREEVSFLGVRSDIAEQLARADLFVLPSRYEGFGIVILEAMASGLPVIVADIDGPAEVVEDGRSGLHFKSGDALDLADKIASLLANESLRKRLASASLLRVRDYSIDVMYQSYLSVYQNAIDSREKGKI